MDTELKSLFINKWNVYFPKAELPIVWFYSNKVQQEEVQDNINVTRCLIGNLNKVREGRTFIYSLKTPGCSGGKRYTGYSKSLRKDFEYFLSYGIEGEMEGERYKKNPELVKEQLKLQPAITADHKYLIFKRWDKLSADDEPQAVIFFAEPDILSGLFTLANYDSPNFNAVIAPFGAGCSSLVQFPLAESLSEDPKCVLGMFDVSARPYVAADTLSFTIPMTKFKKMINNMDESFLITESWEKVKRRIRR